MIKKLKKYIAFSSIIFVMSCETKCVKAYEWAIPPQFDVKADFSEGFANCGRYSHYVDYKGNILYNYPDSGAKYGEKFSYGVALGFDDSAEGSYKFYDKLGNFNDVYKGINPSSFSDGLSVFYQVSTRSFGFLDREFKICIEPIYDQAFDFGEGYAIIKQKDDTLYGYINKLGEIVIEPQFRKAFNFSNGVAVVEAYNGLWGYIDYKGNYVIQPKYEGANAFCDGYAFVSTEDKQGFIDINDNFIEIDNKCSHDSFSEGVCIVKYRHNITDDLYGLINNKGEYVLLPEYDYLSDCNEGIIIALKGQEHFILDASGNVLEEFKEAPPIDVSFKYPYLNRSYENLISAAVEKDGYLKWGYLKNPIANPSEWAKDEIEASFINGIVPHSIAYNYQNKITRKEFCTLLVKMIERTLNTNIPIESRDVFEDTKDIDILKLYYAGVIKGVDGNIFAPDDFITREQAARILMYAGVYMGVPYDKGNGNMYEDIDEISDWAKEAVNLLSYNNIMSGANNKFLPKENFTREQSIVSVYKLFKKF